MRLRVIFNQQKPILVTNLANPFGIGASSVKMDNANGLGSIGNPLLNQAVIHFQRLDIGFDQDRR